jgi:polyphosphate glucokinase
MVVTLGTGFGSAIFVDGRLGPHLELSHHPFRKGKTYDQQLGNAAFKKIGKAKWNRRVKEAIEALRSLTNFDRLYIGGGNAKRIKFKLGPDVRTVPNEYGIKGGARLWAGEESGVAPVAPPPAAESPNAPSEPDSVN